MLPALLDWQTLFLFLQKLLQVELLETQKSINRGVIASEELTSRVACVFEDSGLCLQDVDLKWKRGAYMRKFLFMTKEGKQC